MELEALMQALEEQKPVVLHRPNEESLKFEKISEITPVFDKRGQPDYHAIVLDRVGRPCTVRARDLEVAG